jgi:hypothetical protein
MHREVAGRRWLVPVLAFLASSTEARADEVERRPPLPESLLTESATDIDAEGAGEIEFEANAGVVQARSGGAHTRFASVEVEARVLRNLGLRLEPSYARVVSGGQSAAHDAFGVGGAIALGLFHDFARDIHLQAELLGRTPEAAEARVFEPGESELPFAADLVGAVRFGLLTVRATAGAEAGGGFAHAPLHTDVSFLTGFLPDASRGFLALEVRADWARQDPLVVAPEVVADTTPLGLPFRLGVALPVNVAPEASRPSYGLFLRLVILTAREVEYGHRAVP